MPDQSAALTLTAEATIEAIDPAAWDACAGADNPFVRHAFLAALERSGSAIGPTGWLPRHLAVHDPAGTLVGAAPVYLKSHSYGEYVFDHGWADAYERAGGRYYPKLQCAVPFTPVPGPRLLVRPGAPAETAGLLAAGLRALVRNHEASSAHVTFPTETEWRLLGEAGWLQRLGHQYHWHNRGYGSFDDFLGDLASRKRKAIRKERRTVAEQGLAIHTLTGDDLTQEHWQAFYQFYLDTSDRKWGQPYLNAEFFHELGRTMADSVVLILAEDRGRYVAGALNLIGGDALYGRNWGSDGSYPFLHFEACYYRAIDFAIARGLKRVEAGAQGEHKIQRGYLPTLTYSAHWIADPALRRAVAQYLDRERPAIEAETAALALESPFRQDGCDPD